MTNIISFIQDILLPLIGTSGIIWTILYYKQTRRVKTAEATNSEIDALKNAIQTMREQVDHLNQQIERLHKRVEKKEELVDILRSNLSLKEWKYNLKKQSIAQAYGCSFSKDCPVLERQSLLDSEYLEKIESIKKQKKNETDK